MFSEDGKQSGTLQNLLLNFAKIGPGNFRNRLNNKVFIFSIHIFNLLLKPAAQLATEIPIFARPPRVPQAAGGAPGGVFRLSSQLFCVVCAK